MLVSGGTIVDVNQSFLSLMGYASRDDALRVPPSCQMTLGSAAIQAEDVAARLTGKVPSAPLAMEVVRTDGTIVAVEASVIAWHDDPSIALILVRDVTEREESIRALKESEQLYRALAENIPVGVGLADASGRTLYVNEHAVEMTGYSVEELMAPIWFVHHDDSRALELCEQAFAGAAASLPHETRVITKDGRERWVSVVFAPVRGADGSFAGVVTVWQDIDERKRAEETLRETEARFRLLAENASDVIWEMGMDGVFNYVSPAVRRYGYTQEEWVGSRLEPFLHPDELESYQQTFSVPKDYSVPRRYEMRLLSKGGQTAWMEVLVDSIVRDGVSFRLQGISRDITERKASEEALRESEEKFRSMVENTSDLIFVTDANMHPLYASPSVREVLGYEPEEMMDIGVEVTHPDDRDAVLAVHERAVRGEAGRAFTCRVIAKSGQTKWMSYAWSPIMRDGRLYRVVTVVRDVTERTLNEVALREAHEALERAHKLQSEFLNNVTHEVRTPLTAVQGYAKMLLEGLAGSLNEEQSGLLRKVLASSDNLLAVVDGVLEVTRLRSGRIDLRPQLCKPWRIATKAVSSVFPQAQSKGIEIGVVSPDHDCAGVYDRQKLMLILVNLMSNAVKFTETGSVRVEVTCDSKCTEFIVIDTGIGIDCEDVPAVFEEFVQGSDQQRHKPQGFGVGLALVCALVRAIDGTLVLSSAKGFGTAFTLHVPVLDAP